MGFVSVIMNVVLAAMLLAAASQKDLEATIAFAAILLAFKEDNHE